MPLSSIAYTSQAADGLTPDQLSSLVRDASHHNRLAGVTGVLLFDGSRFLQYLEGPQEGLEFVFARVQNSKRHQGIVELARGQGGVRRFPYWSMHLIPVDQHELHAAAVASWAVVEPQPGTEAEAAPGLGKVAALVAPHLQHGA